MKRPVLITISVLGLMMTLLPAIGVLVGLVPFDQYLLWMLAGMICWFVSAPFWMNRRHSKPAKS